MNDRILDSMIREALMPDDELQCLIDMREELARLRGIEAAVMNIPHITKTKQGEILPVTCLRLRAILLRDSGRPTDADYLDAIAGALEAK